MLPGGSNMKLDAVFAKGQDDDEYAIILGGDAIVVFNSTYRDIGNAW